MGEDLRPPRRHRSEEESQVPKVCIVIVNWNGWKDTVKCLASLRRLDYGNVEILIIDNGSTDDSIRRINESFPNTRIIESKRNLGFSGGCNIGIRHALEAGSSYVWLLNNDTTVDSGALLAMVEVAERDPHVGAVGSILYDMHAPQRVQAWGGGRVNVWFGRSSHQTRETSGDSLSYLTGASLLLRSKSLREVGLLDEGFFMYWEDADLCFRVRSGGWKLAVARHSQVWHKESASSGKNKLSFDRYLWTSTVRFCQRHAPFALLATVVASVRMIAKRIFQLDWVRAARLCETIAAHSRIVVQSPEARPRVVDNKKSAGAKR